MENGSAQSNLPEDVGGGGATPIGSGQPDISIAESSSLHSLDVVFQLVREQYTGQQSYTGSLDAKAGFILGSATLLTGVLAVWQIPKGVDHSSLAQLIGPSAQSIIQALPIVAIGIYLAVVVTAYMGYLPFRFLETPDPNNLLSKYLSSPEQETKLAVLSTTLSAFSKNQQRLSFKAFWIQLAFIALFLEALVVAALLIVSNLH